MEDAAEHQHVGRGQQVAEEVARVEAQPVGEAVFRNVALEDGPDLRQVEAAAGQVRVRLGDLNGQASLRGADIDERPVPPPVEALGYGPRDGQAQPRHPAQHQFEARRVGVERRREEFVAAGLGLVLRLAGPERVGQRAPERVAPPVAQPDQPAQVGLAPGVEVEVGFRRVGLAAVAAAIQEPERHQRVEEVARRPEVDAEAGAQRLGALRPRLGGGGEDAYGARDVAISRFEGVLRRLGSITWNTQRHR